MTPKKFRSLALALPEAHEAPHFEHASFRVGKKIFATLNADGVRAMVRVTPYERIDALLKTYPDAFFSYGYWTERNGSLGVILGKAKEALLKELLTDSWRTVAPNRVQASLVTGH